MKKQQEAALLAAFEKAFGRMTDGDREMIVDFAEACAEERPRRHEYLRLVESGVSQ